MGNIAAILLAAGESTRMGQLKALLPWQGLPLVEYQVSNLRDSGVTRLIVVVGHRKEDLEPYLAERPGLETIFNPDYMQGKSTSLKAGLRALVDLPDVGILILNVDQPRSSDVISRVTAEHAKTSCLITIPCYNGRGGHPVVLSPSLMPELLEISEDSMGLKSVVRRHEHEVHCPELDTPEVLLDLNTPDDYRLALELPESPAVP